MFYIVDGREGRLSAWLLFGFEKKWIKDPNYSALFEQASKQNQVGMKFVGIQGAGSPYIGMLDHAKLVNPEETPKNLGGLA